MSLLSIDKYVSIIQYISRHIELPLPRAPVPARRDTAEKTKGAGPSDTQLSLRSNLLVATIGKHGGRSRFVEITAFDSPLK